MASAAEGTHVRRTVADALDDDTLHLSELLAEVAAEHNIVFVPTAKSHNGKPIYSFGARKVITNDSSGIILAKVGAEWQPISLDALINESR